MPLLAKVMTGMVVAAFVVPVLVKSIGHGRASETWYNASREPTGLTPDAAVERRALVQVYAAPTWGWRGIFAVHTWIVTKPEGGDVYTRWDVVGWGGGRVVRQNYLAPDARWYGSAPELLLDIRGAAAADHIPAIEAAVASYAWPETYRSFPGPNSNTFLAHIGRSIPALGLDLPPTAIGKDFRPLSEPIGSPPSGRGVQISLLGLAGVILSPEEGIEINLAGLSIGLDLAKPALRLPSFGRVEP
ncbi:MAG: DUF3750 domain-containing protein [Alphaproteobacteria bacterium]|nr:DUF3750 domain-containing protein [Alphaproteobacteria bacterium]